MVSRQAASPTHPEALGSLPDSTNRTGHWQGGNLSPSFAVCVFCQLDLLKLHFCFFTCGLRRVTNTLKKGKVPAMYWPFIWFSDRQDGCGSPHDSPQHHPAVKPGCVFPFSLFTQLCSLILLLKIITACRAA